MSIVRAEMQQVGIRRYADRMGSRNALHSTALHRRPGALAARFRVPVLDVVDRERAVTLGELYDHRAGPRCGTCFVRAGYRARLAGPSDAYRTIAVLAGAVIAVVPVAAQDNRFRFTLAAAAGRVQVK